MEPGPRRKRQPERLRAQLLEHGARLCSELGVAGLTLQALADAAGVTKGGLLHHFPNKQALVEAIFDESLCALQRQIAQSMAEDPEPHGRFTRAYVRATFALFECSEQQCDSAFMMTTLTEPSLSARWWRWFHAQLDASGEPKDDPALAVARFAADGLWLAAMQAGGIQHDAAHNEAMRAVMDRLTRPAR